MSQNENNPTSNAGTPGTPGIPGAAGSPVPTHLVEAFFDRELDPPARLELFALLRKDLRAAAEMERVQAVVDLLREVPPAPDLTSRVMERYDAARRPARVNKPAPAMAPARARPLAARDATMQPVDPLARFTRRTSPWVRLASWSMAAAIVLAAAAALVIQLSTRAPVPEIASVSGAERVVPAPSPMAVAPSGVSAPSAPVRPSAVVPAGRRLGELRVGSLAVRPLAPLRDGDIVVPGGSGVISVFTWASAAEKDPWARTLARSTTLIEGLELTELRPLPRDIGILGPSLKGDHVSTNMFYP